MLFLDHNELSGNFPVLTFSQQLLVLDISDNQLAGSVPPFGLAAAGPDAAEYAARYLSLDASFGSAMDISIADNPLVGSLPAWLATFPLEVGRKASNNWCRLCCGPFLLATSSIASCNRFRAGHRCQQLLVHWSFA